MRQPGREFSKGCQLIALLLGAGHFSNAVCHYANQTATQFGHALQHLREDRRWKAEHTSWSKRANGKWVRSHPGKGQHAGNLSCTSSKDRCISSSTLAPALGFSLKINDHRIGGAALPYHHFAGSKMKIFCA